MLFFLIISVVSALLSGMGIGGGAIFVILSTLLLGFEQKEAQAINLIMFLAAGISSTIFNLKNNLVEKNICKKILPLIIIGGFIGTILVKNIESEDLRLYFGVFMAFIGGYEIISSVVSIKKAKNNEKERSVGNGMP